MLKKPRIDPRYYQISILSSLVIYGYTFLDFEIELPFALTVVVTALASQYTFTKFLTDKTFDPRSCLISALSLCLLLRTGSLGVAALCAFITIGAKFTFRFNGKHIFNPTNFGLIAVMLLFENAWVSPGQWGSAAVAGFFIACLGFLVVNRAERSDVTWAFMFFYSLLLFARAYWLGDPLSIPLHQLQNGAFLIFTFFMISDPRTTPDTRQGRILFALLVALGAYYISYVMFEVNGLIWSLGFFALTVPVIDMLFPGSKYEWEKYRHKKIQINGEVPAK